jgi:hypothetical protein
VTATGYVREDLAVLRPGESGTGIPVGWKPFEGLADRLAWLYWCWPALLALALGLYQMGRPELPVLFHLGGHGAHRAGPARARPPAWARNPGSGSWAADGS